MIDWFVILMNKRKKRFLVLRTPYIDALETVMSHQDRTKFALHSFGTSYREKLARISFIDYLRKEQKYKFSVWVMIDFFKFFN